MRTAVLALVVCVLWLPISARAECTTELLGTVSEEEADERLAFLRREMPADRRRVLFWKGAWFTTFSVGAIGQTALTFAFDDRDNQLVFGLAAARSFLGAAAIPVLGKTTHKLELVGDRCADLAHAEHVLVRNVRSQEGTNMWFKHGSIVAVNGISLLILGLGYDLWTRAAIGGVVGAAFGEAQIFTRPRGAKNTLSAYRSDRWRLQESEALELHYAPVVVGENGWGLGVTGRF